MRVAHRRCAGGQKCVGVGLVAGLLLVASLASNAQAATVPLATAAAGIPQVCQSWFGPGVNAMACDPTELAAAIQNGTVGTSGTLTIAGTGTSSSTSPGVTQAVGPPLTPGQSLTITGSASAGTELFVLTRVGGIVRQVAFTAPALNLGAAQVVATADGGATLIRNGYPTIDGSVIHVTNTAQPSRPQLTATRFGNHIAVRVGVHASTQVLVALVGRNGSFVAGRRIVVHRYRTIVFRYRRTITRAEAVAVGPNDSFSSVVVTTHIRTPAKRRSSWSGSAW